MAELLFGATNRVEGNEGGTATGAMMRAKRLRDRDWGDGQSGAAYM